MRVGDLRDWAGHCDADGGLATRSTRDSRSGGRSRDVGSEVDHRIHPTFEAATLFHSRAGGLGGSELPKA